MESELIFLGGHFFPKLWVESLFLVSLVLDCKPIVSWQGEGTSLMFFHSVNKDVFSAYSWMQQLTK